ncbi:MAG: helix-turn-helix transcriptional regulator [Bacteroidota bacterium]
MSIAVKKYYPPEAFNPFIKEICFYTIRGQHCLHFMPEGCVELIFQLNGDSTQSMRKDGAFRARPPIFIGGLHNQSYFVEACSASYQSIGIKLVPKAAKAILGINVNALKNQIIDANDIFDIKVNELLDQLIETSKQAQQVELIINWLEPYLARLSNDFRPLGLEMIWASQGRIQVGELARQNFYSSSNYRKRFRETIGLSPSEYLKLVRVRTSLAHVQNLQVPIQQIAYNLGYFDPAHFTREFKAILQCSPRAYRQAKQRN